MGLIDMHYFICITQSLGVYLQLTQHGKSTLIFSIKKNKEEEEVKGNLKAEFPVLWEPQSFTPKAFN